MTMNAMEVANTTPKMTPAIQPDVVSFPSAIEDFCLLKFYDDVSLTFDDRKLRDDSRATLGQIFFRIRSRGRHNKN
jgi:hypothetical protein